MDIKDWILIGGGALLAAVIGHGFWLAWRSRRDPLKMDLDPNIPADDVDELTLLRGELPNGGARVVAEPSVDKTQSQQTLDLTPSLGGSAARGAAGDLAKPKPTPTLVTENRTGTRNQRADAPHTEAPVEAPDAEEQRSDTPRPDARPITAAAPRKSILDRPKPKLAPHNRDVVAAKPVAAKPVVAKTVAAKPLERERTVAAAPSTPDEIIVVHVLARGNARFPGAELMNTFLRNSLKFGDMNIFHRIDPISKQARFSVASAVEPGTFDLSKMDTFSTAGVTFFLRLPGPPDPLATFEDMLGVARDVATSLAGDLKDDQRSVLTAQTIEHCRQRISEFSRKRMSQRG